MKAHGASRRIARLPLCLALVFASCTRDQDPASVPRSTEPEDPPAVERGEPFDETYARLMNIVAEKLEEDIAAWATTDFQTQAEAGEALFRLTPAGARSREHVRAALAQVELTPEELASLMEEHPEAVEEGAELLRRRLEAAHAKHEDRIAAIEILPPGDLDGAHERNLALLRRARTPSRGESDPSPLDDWTEITTVSDLEAEIDAASRAGQPVIVFVRADWAAPAATLERDVFPTPTVQNRLAGYNRLLVDVTGGGGGAAAIQDTLRAVTIPAILVFADAEPLAAFLAGRAPRPKPTTAFRDAVDASTLLDRLPE